MADKYDENTGYSASEISEDDPLAELARIIGYDRPEEQPTAVGVPGDEAGGDDAIDLEAELMRELESDQREPDASDPVAADPVAADPVANVPVSHDTPVRDNTTTDEPDEIPVADDWLAERPSSPASDEFPPNENLTTSSASEPVFTIPEQPVEPDLPEEELFDALEQELAISADDLALDDADTVSSQGTHWPDEEVAGEQVAAATAARPVAETVPDLHPTPPVAGMAPADDKARSVDDILSEMARFKIPEHDVSAQSVGQPDAFAVPDKAENSIGEPAVSVAAVDEAENAFDELEAEFDNSAESFLSDEEFDLDADVLEPVEPPLHQSAPEADDDIAQTAAETGTPEGVVDGERENPAQFQNTLDGDDDIASAFSDLLREQPYVGTAETSSADADEGAKWLENTEEEEKKPLPNFFGDASVLAAGAASMTPNRTHSGDDKNAGAETGDLTENPDFDEKKWLDTLGTDENQDGGTSSGPYAQAPGSDDNQISSRPDGVLSFPVSDLAASQTHGDELSPPDIPNASPGSEVFDESAISDTDQSPYTVSDFDVPDLPVEETPAAPDDDNYFDNDLDLEFADLVETASQEVRSGHAAGRQGDVDGGPTGANTEEEYAALADNLGLTDASDADEPYRSRPRPVPVDADAALSTPVVESDNKRGPLIAGVVLGAAVLFGGIAIGWSWLSGGSSDGEGPKIIMADKEPVKVLPENPGGLNVPNQDKAVYDKVDGNGSGIAGQQSLRDSSEEPVDVVRKTIDPDLLPLEGRDPDDTAKVEDRLTADDNDNGVTAPGVASPVVSPRKVRTMVVRPDGTIVPREDPVEQIAAAEPVAEPQPETPPSGVAANSGDVAAQTPAVTPAQTQPPATETPAPAAETPAATAETEVAETAGAETEAETETDGLPPVRTVTTVPIRKTPVPATRPSDQPVNVVGQVSGDGRVTGAQATNQQAAVQTPQPTPEPVAAPAAPPVNNGGYYVQIASQPSEDAARATYANLSRRYSGLIGGLGVDIQRADIPNKGVFHRVRIPAGGRSEANSLCQRYKSAGGSCFVTR